MQTSPIETDAVVVGAGPVGLFQVFQLGLLGIQAHIVDVLPHPGGQCVELYPDKPIYDIPGIAVCTGRELTERLLAQIAPFNASFHLGHEISGVARQSDGRFLVDAGHELRFLTRTIFIAAGVGAFKPRSLALPGIEHHLGSQLFHDAHAPERFAAKHLVIVGGDDAALEQAIALCPNPDQPTPHAAASVTLLHRRELFQAEPARVEQIHALCQARRMQFIAGQVSGFEATEGRITQLQVSRADGSTQTLPLDALLVLLGLSPKLGPIAHWGLAMQRRQLVVDTATFTTAEPGIFAVGDINTYPGKKKLILCGFHEATLAAYGAAALLWPNDPVNVQYTTTSTQLHKRLGVDTPAQSV